MPVALHRMPAPGTSQDIHIPAPMGGTNTVSPASAMPPGDATYLYNLIAGELGLRTRSGFREWCTGLQGALDSEVRTVLPFTGSLKSGAGNKLFACTSTGIWDVSASGIVSHEWLASEDYSVGERVRNDSGKVYECSVAGASAASGGPTGTGTEIVDGTVTWTYVAALVELTEPTQVMAFPITSGEAGYGTGTVVATPAGRFLVYCDEENGMYVYTETTSIWEKVTQGGGAGQIAGVDPANLVFATVWKSRLWLVERDTSKAWYLEPLVLFGTATAFDFGQRMRAGGPLVGLYSWSYDAGGGLEALLVAISGAGDVIAYQGTDPSDLDTFAIRGAWSVAGVPPGRRIAIDQGGDILVLSLIGVVPLSKLVAGASVEEKGIYATSKISNLFTSLVAIRKNLLGWGLYIHPTDNALVVPIPSAGETQPLQLAMSLNTRGWGFYRDLPIFSAGVWERELYFGTSDGRVCINMGDVDGVTLANPDVYTPIRYSACSAYSNFGNARTKQVVMVRPIVRSAQSMPIITAAAKYDFDQSEIVAPDESAISNDDGTWDAAVWDDAIWATESTYQPSVGAIGSGRAIAIAVRGSSITRTTWIGTDITLIQGGAL